MATSKRTAGIAPNGKPGHLDLDMEPFRRLAARLLWQLGVPAALLVAGQALLLWRSSAVIEVKIDATNKSIQALNEALAQEHLEAKARSESYWQEGAKMKSDNDKRLDKLEATTDMLRDQMQRARMK